MFQNLKALYGKRLAATDGHIGHLEDFYFEDRCWAVRYLVVDSSSWLPGRQVLLAPTVLGPRPFDQLLAGRNYLQVNLDRRQIENSPPIGTHRPVSRQYEVEYHRHYGWPEYWSGGLLGGAGTPAAVTSPTAMPRLQHGDGRQDDQHLRSTNSLTGYAVQATDGVAGSVRDFTVDGRDWSIREVAVWTGSWFSGKEIFVLPANVVRISYEQSALFVNLTKEDLHHTSRHDVAQAGARLH